MGLSTGRGLSAERVPLSGVLAALLAEVELSPEVGVILLGPIWTEGVLTGTVLAAESVLL